MPNEQTARGLTASERPAYDAGKVSESTGDKSAMASFGETLRRERELRRISLREVNEATKINIRYLEALERNDFTYLPAGAFTRGFIRSYARYIGLDETEMINAYLYELGRQQEDREAEGASVPEPAGSPDDPLRHLPQLDEERAVRQLRNRRILVVVVFLLVLAAIVTGTVFAVRHFGSAATLPTFGTALDSVRP
jgi:cytoskeletal protein RodZ